MQTLQMKIIGYAFLAQIIFAWNAQIMFAKNVLNTFICRINIMQIKYKFFFFFFAYFKKLH